MPTKCPLITCYEGDPLLQLKKILKRRKRCGREKKKETITPSRSDVSLRENQELAFSVISQRKYKRIKPT